MKRKVLFVLVFLPVLIFSVNVFSKEVKEIKGILITGFPEGSAMKEAGAEAGDILTHYDGVKIESAAHLGKLKEKVKTDKVEVKVLRAGKELTFTIPKGFIGIYLKELMPDHVVKPDAKVIDGIGKLSWGIGMENSFLACIYLLEQKYGMKTSYVDILGLSGYGFRIAVHPELCPSSPDATIPRDVGSEVLKKLGYSFEYYFQEGFDDNEPVEGLNYRNEDDLRKLIMKSIDDGWPVIAIDLIEVPEWGLITGYQNGGKELFCRTYFDKTDGYEIARKFPWVIVIIKDHKDVDLKPMYKESLVVAMEMYKKTKYGDYYSGLRASTYWKDFLNNKKSLDKIKKKKRNEVMHGNWWIYMSLLEARAVNVQYLKDHKNDFGIPVEDVKRLALLCEKEVEYLKSSLEYVPSRWENKSYKDWTVEMRMMQAKTIYEFNLFEQEILKVLEKNLK